ncbi:YbfB/YjiJ family MFS transporter, partial [Salmonella enterica subsp. enterica serovar Anatum]|nr:YbfB/YjiJ family MFS transporter [Salmonella enterica subsp. enterica serovar Anatum]
TYGIGQILGPLAASLSGNGASAIINATLCGAAALFFAALISAEVHIDGRDYTIENTGGNLTFTPDQPLSDGQHTISVTVTDIAGN